MRPTRRAMLALGVLGGAVVLAYSTTARAQARSPTPPRRTPDPTPGGGWADADAPRRIRELARPLATRIGWPDLPDFLVAIAWTESRGNSQARANSSENAARGWFGMRPASARVGDAGLTADALMREPESIALATWYLHRLQPYAKAGQVIDLLALRRGMAYPYLVADTDESMSTPKDGPGERSGAVRERLGEGLAAAGLGPDFMYRPAFSPVYDWPGIVDALSTVRARAVA